MMVSDDGKVTCALCIEETSPRLVWEGVSFCCSHLAYTLFAQAYPGWSVVRYSPQTALLAAQLLVKWCREHHGHTLVKRRYDPKQCDDEPGQLESWRVLRWMKEKALQEDSEPFKDAFAVLDEEFGPEVWRTKRGKPPILSPCSLLGV